MKFVGIGGDYHRVKVLCFIIVWAICCRKTERNEDCRFDHHKNKMNFSEKLNSLSLSLSLSLTHSFIHLFLFFLIIQMSFMFSFFLFHVLYIIHVKIGYLYMMVTAYKCFMCNSPIQLSCSLCRRQLFSRQSLYSLCLSHASESEGKHNRERIVRKILVYFNISWTFLWMFYRDVQVLQRN
jgi:hypothetical protein